MTIWHGTGTRGGGYGRTRRPGSLTGTDGLAIPESFANVVELNAAPAADVPTRGHSTENQRFLHIATAAGTVTAVYAYSHAAGQWAEYPEPLDPANPITVAPNTYRIIEIDGIDRIAFTFAGGEVFAAVSTF